MVAVVCTIFWPKREDTSFLTESSAKLDASAPGGQKQLRQLPIRGASIQAGVEGQVGRGANAGPTHEPTKYRAVQVVQRMGGDPDRILPIGTNFIGRLLSAVDTREPGQLVKVGIPYGASFDGERRIERNSTIFGTVNYPGKSDKVYIKFHRLLFPNGQEFKIEAQALGSLDYSPGLIGEYHGTGTGRIASTVGLTMLSGISDVMVEREMPGQNAIMPTPRATLKNGFYNGLAKATEQEAQRQAESIGEEPDFVTIEAGDDVIISLTETFKGESP